MKWLNRLLYGRRRLREVKLRRSEKQLERSMTAAFKEIDAILNEIPAGRLRRSIYTDSMMAMWRWRRGDLIGAMDIIASIFKQLHREAKK